MPVQHVLAMGHAIIQVGAPVHLVILVTIALNVPQITTTTLLALVRCLLLICFIIMGY